MSVKHWIKGQKRKIKQQTGMKLLFSEVLLQLKQPKRKIKKVAVRYRKSK